MAKAKVVEDESVEELKDIPIVKTIPYEGDNRVAAFKAKVRAQNALDNTPEPAPKGTGYKISPHLLAYLIKTWDSVEGSLRAEIDKLFEQIGVKAEHKAAARELLKDPKFFDADAKLENLKEIGLVAGSQQPDVPQGMPAKEEDARYYPTRYKDNPDDDAFEDGDLIYFVMEDQTYTALSVEQQQRAWQSSHVLPRMNALRRIGGREFGEIPEVPKAKSKSKTE